jgi:hypothetical protein
MLLLYLYVMGQNMLRHGIGVPKSDLRVRCEHVLDKTLSRLPGHTIHTKHR